MKLKFKIRKEFAEIEIATIDFKEDLINETGICIKDLVVFDREAEILVESCEEK